MPDALFADPRLAPLYDALDGPRDDLDHYVAIVRELSARSALDVGGGTGSLALRLAEIGLDVTVVDPAGGSLDGDEWAAVRPGGGHREDAVRAGRPHGRRPRGELAVRLVQPRLRLPRRHSRHVRVDVALPRP